VRGVHGERGLAETRGAVHDCDAHRSRTARSLFPDQERAQVRDMGLTASEVANIRRELRRTRPRCGCTTRCRSSAGHRSVGDSRQLARAVPGRRGRRVAGQQLRVQALQLAARIHAKLIRYHLPGLGVRFKCLSPAPRFLKCAHQQRPEPLPQRVIRYQATQLGHHLGRPAARKVRLDAQLGRVEPQLGRALGLGLKQW
jgi:hypothetical protein